jgi:hypothetical protein
MISVAVKRARPVTQGTGRDERMAVMRASVPPDSSSRNAFLSKTNIFSALVSKYIRVPLNMRVFDAFPGSEAHIPGTYLVALEARLLQ